MIRTRPVDGRVARDDSSSDPDDMVFPDCVRECLEAVVNCDSILLEMDVPSKFNGNNYSRSERSKLKMDERWSKGPGKASAVARKQFRAGGQAEW